MHAKGIKGIILMGGSGSRFGSELPKQFHKIAGKKVYLYTLEQFLKIDEFEQIILVCPPSAIEQVRFEIARYNDPRLKVISGGSSRQQSSYFGLQACGKQTQYVVIHDGVRPFVSERILRSNIESAILHGAVDTCIPSTDTIVHACRQDKIDAIPQRSEYYRGQTPQSFSYPLILEAHKRAQEDSIELSSDDCSLALGLKHPVHIVLGDEENIKITTELDLFLAEQILRLKQVPLSSKQLQERSLQGKKYVITGGLGGIGKAIVNQLLAQDAIAIPISRTSSPFQADLTDADQVKDIFEKIQQEYGPLDGVINCFGKLINKDVSQLQLSEIDELIGVNLSGIIYCSKWAQIKRGGHIVNIASSSYIRGKKGYAVYAAAKAGVVNFTQGLAEERPDLHINVVIPQRTKTSMRLLNFPQEDFSELLDPDDVAATVVSLLHNQDLTGSLVEVRKQFKTDRIPNHKALASCLSH